ncbi:helix-turn-helix domain-containing protein [Actinomadura sp. KC216]|uniref:MarR family transcriptional regulator n=1 Tax=Actinomadura sp. KC216 TaxID=2530370 RepID=UPI001FB572F2|nr:helix-turn-helix domain-containing protein [Actinomadura sp. KC216]
MTTPTRAALRVLLMDPTRRWSAAEICERAELARGSIHALLARLEAQGLLGSELEDIDESAEGRRARRLYWFTPGGAQDAAVLLAEYDARLGRRRHAAPSTSPALETP